MFNSIKILDKAFDYLNNEERKLNYEYDPRSEKKDESWKRHLFFFELKKDFIKDIQEFGFCPYIEKPYDEQRKDKNIMKFIKKGNLSRTDYIKNLYKKITNNSNNNNNNNKLLIAKRKKYNLSPKKNNSMKNLNYKLGNTKNKNKNTFLLEIYNKINYKNQMNNIKFKKLLNSSKSNVDNTEFLNHKKNNKNDDSHDENSFIYEPETGNQRYNDNYYYKAYKEKYDNTNNKNESSSDNSTSNRNMIFLNNKSTIYNNAKNEVKKNGWRMTTSMETGRFKKSSKVLFSDTKNFSKYKNEKGFSIHRNEKINKSKKYKLKRSISNIDIIPKSIINNNLGNKKKYNEKKYKLFVHIKKMKY
jgi:hypothetical protein